MAIHSSSNHKTIPILRPLLPKTNSVIKYIRKIDLNQRYTNSGPLVHELEARYAEILGTEKEKVVAVANATLGIAICVQILPPAIWKVPDFTFAATPLAVLNAGKKFKLVDVNDESWVMDNHQNPDDDTFGSIPVLPFGNNAEFQNWATVQNVVFDAAASLGDTVWKLSKLGINQAAVFSLHATKVFGAGEGGLVVCGSFEFAEKVRASANFGFLMDRTTSTYGTNAKMSEYTAAVALASVDEREIEISQWSSSQALAREISKNFRQLNPNLAASPVNPYWLVKFRSEKDLLAFINEANSKKIETRRWWPKAIHEMSFFKDMNLNVSNTFEELTNSAQLARTILGLPMSRLMTRSEFERIEDVMNDFGKDRFFTKS